jgi:hypothetical protein
LPEAGSFQEQLLSEAIVRERNAQFAMVALFARLLGAMAGVQPKMMHVLLEEYREELYQLRYNPKYRTISKVLVEEEMSKVAEETRLMRKVAALTVSDEELSTFRRKALEKVKAAKKAKKKKR